ncbi:MAG: hypothetical protein AB7E47_03305 [Desulfovibrionaceae bacterium]
MDRLKILSSNSQEMSALVRFLGLPRNVRAFTLRASVDEVPTVEATYFPRENDPEPITELRPLAWQSEWELP